MLSKAEQLSPYYGEKDKFNKMSSSALYGLLKWLWTIEDNPFSCKYCIAASILCKGIFEVQCGLELQLNADSVTSTLARRCTIEVVEISEEHNIKWYHLKLNMQLDTMKNISN